MAPSSAKRKRPERGSSYDESSNRPSPHRPENLPMAQQSERGREGRRGGSSRRQSRQGGPQSPTSGANAVSAAPRRAGHPERTQQQQSRAAHASDVLTTENSRAGTPVQRPGFQPSQKELAHSTEEEAVPVSVPYPYDHVTDERVAAWQGKGRESLLGLCKDPDLPIVSAVVQELVRSALDNRLDAADAGTAIAAVIDLHQSTGLDVQTLVIDSISMLPAAEYKRVALQKVVAATNIDPKVFRAILDVELLVGLRLVRDTFPRVRTRKTTQMLYKQANFNLMREESEGYAKLITEYFNTAQSARANADPNMAVPSFERIKALVGAFDLDVGRVLDITLDVSANLLVRAYQFFLKFYRCSSWWPGPAEDAAGFPVKSVGNEGYQSLPSWAEPGSDTWDTAEWKEQHSIELAHSRRIRDRAFWNRVKVHGIDAFFDLGAPNIADLDDIRASLEQELPPETDSKGQESNADKRKRINESRKYMLETGTLPPAGNPDAAQLLGFKLRFYASRARDATDTLPENLIPLAALLIKVGFISLRDLYPHLYPPDEAMPAEKDRLEKEKADKERKERPGGGGNALATAGALADDTVPAVRNLRGATADAKSGGSSPRPDSKDEGVKGELPLPANQKILLLKSLLLIGALPEALYILGRFSWLTEVDTTLTPHLHRIANFMLSSIAETLHPLPERAGFADLRTGVVDSMPDLGGDLVMVARPRKIVRWLYADKENEGSLFYYADWADNLPTCQTVDDAFLLCNTFLSYLGVKVGQDHLLYTRLVRLAKRSLETDQSDSNRMRWLDLIRRTLVPALSLTKHNVGITNEVYELLMLFPTTTRYNIYAEWYTGRTSRLPDIASAFERNKYEVRDVLRRVTNESGKKQARALAKVCLSSPGIVMRMVVSQLESYSNMIPSLVECMRYFSLLAYDVLVWSLINSLQGQGRDTRQADGMLTSPWLQALSNFVASLFARHGGTVSIVPVLQYIASELRSGNSGDLEVFEQILGEMAGIKADIVFSDAQVLAMAGGELLQLQTVSQMGDSRSSKKSQAKRLMKALTDSGLTGQILVAIAQQWQMYPNKEDNKYMPLKVLGNNFDKIESVYSQYTEVLKHYLGTEEFAQQVPSVLELVGSFGLDPGGALAVYRHVLAQRIAEVDDEKKRAEQKEKKRRLSQEKEGTKDDAEGEPEVLPVTDGAAAIIDEAKTPGAGGDFDEAKEKPSWHPVLQPIIDGLTVIVPGLSDSTSVPFYVTFWTLTQQDVLVHTDSYDLEMKKLNRQISDINADRSDLTTQAAKERDRKKKALLALVDELSKEMKGRIAAYTKVRNRLSGEKMRWFERSTDRGELDKRHVGLLQECFLPRAMLSSLDAHYCFLMLKVLHNGGTPGFSTMHLLNQLFKKQQLAALMFRCTSNEAQNLGRFMCETLRLLQHWHAEKNVYEREAFGSKKQLPGFAKKLDAQGKPEIVLEFEDFRRLLFNWHSFINGALKLCFDSGEYMHTRNGIIVLRAVVVVFPSVNFMGRDMLNQVEKMSKEETRQDLKLAATSLIGPLKQREKSWIMPQAFRLNDPLKDGAAKAPSRSGSALPETPRLNVQAPDFQPRAEVPVNGSGSRKQSVAGPEEGEVEDVKMSDTTERENQADAQLIGKPFEPVKSAPIKEGQALTSSPAPADEAAKDSTPALLPSKAPPKDTARSDSRPPSGLPAKLEAQPGRPLRDRTDNSRYGGRNDDRYGRLERPSDVTRPNNRSGEVPSSRERSPAIHSGQRTPDQHGLFEAREARAAMRDDRQPPRSYVDERVPREDLRNNGRSRTFQPQAASYYGKYPSDSRSGQGGAMAPPSSTAQAPQRSVMSSVASIQHSEQASRPSSSGTQSAGSPANDTAGVNPDRLAFIQENTSGSRDRSSRDASHEERHQQGSTYADERAPNGYPSRSEMDRRSHGVSSAHLPPDRRDESSEFPPTGPRGSRQAQHSSRELFEPNPHSHVAVSEGNRGRPRSDMAPPSAPQDSSYGRLNGPHDGPPSGPRQQTNSASARGGRNTNGLHSNGNASRPNEPLNQSSASVQPEPPASFRSNRLNRRDSGPVAERQQSSVSVPTTPSAEANSIGGVHPSRAQFVGGSPQIQTNIPSNHGPVAASSPTAPPSGPRGPNWPPAGTPTGPSPVNSMPPSGPGGRRTQVERQRANINAQLQGTATSPNGAPNPGVSFRGASNRQNNPNMPLPGHPQTMPSPLEPSRREASFRQDGPGRQELFGRAALNEEPGSRGGSRSRHPDEDRAERHRGSRNASRERRPDVEPPRRPEVQGKETQGQVGRTLLRDDGRLRDSDRDQRVPRPDDAPPRRPPLPDQATSFAGPQYAEARSDNRPPRGLDDGRRVATRGGRSSEPRRDLGPRPPREDSLAGGRKRRHDDGQFDESKRRRGGR